MIKVYIAGPMTNVGGNYNFPLFDQVADALQTAGYSVFSPAYCARKIIGSDEIIFNMDKLLLMETVRQKIMPENLKWICQHAEAMVMLPGWRHSDGASVEYMLAVWRRIPFYELPNIVVDADWLPELHKTITVQQE
jgi:Domain of unknown function (DUF4406)